MGRIRMKNENSLMRLLINSSTDEDPSRVGGGALARHLRPDWDFLVKWTYNRDIGN